MGLVLLETPAELQVAERSFWTVMSESHDIVRVTIRFQKQRVQAAQLAVGERESVWVVLEALPQHPAAVSVPVPVPVVALLLVHTDGDD